MSRTALGFALVAGLLLVACGGGRSDDAGGGSGTPPPGPPPAGSNGEKRLNTHTPLDQQRPAAAGNASGQAVVIWESFAQDGSHFGIFGRRLLNGEPVGEEFAVNSYSIGRQTFPAVAMNASGEFIAVWRSSLQGGPGGTIYGQRFAADGSRIGGEFQIGPDDSDLDSQSEPQVVLRDNGEFAVAFSNRQLDEVATALGRNDLETRFIQFRLYNADGSPRTAPITATESAADGSPRFSRLGLDGEGRMVLVWINGNQIRARHFDAAGAALSEPYNVNTTAANLASDQPALVVAPDGRYAIAWEAYTFGNQPLGIQMQRYSAPQTADGGLLTIGSPDSGLIERVSLTLDAAGDYLVAAQALDETRLMRVAADGRQHGPVRFSNAQFPAMFPSVARASAGKALVAWQTRGQDGDGRGIVALQLALP